MRLCARRSICYASFPLNSRPQPSRSEPHSCTLRCATFRPIFPLCTCAMSHGTGAQLASFCSRLFHFYITFYLFSSRFSLALYHSVSEHCTCSRCTCAPSPPNTAQPLGAQLVHFMPL